VDFIKAFLVVAVLILAIFTFRNRARVEIRASIRLGVVLLAAAAIASILDPNLTQRAANVVGVTRGTDLLLYVLIVVFAFAAVSAYFRFRQLEHVLARVIRNQAIRDAVRADGPPGQRSVDEPLHH
jgi:hypothetical protein